MEINMELKAYPRGLQDKAEPLGKFVQYFDAQTLDALIMALRYGQRYRYFSYEVTLAQSFIVREETHRARTLRLDVFKEPYDPHGTFKLGEYRLNYLYPKIEKGESLTEKELNDVLQTLPNEMAERYLRFRLTNLDQEKLREIIEPRPTAADEDYDTVEYRGLSLTGTKGSYLGEGFDMEYRHRQALRLLIQKQGGLCFKDDFTDGYASVFGDSEHKDVDTTLRKLISAIRVELKPIVGYDCIKNVPGEGWYLNLKP